MTDEQHASPLAAGEAAVGDESPLVAPLDGTPDLLSLHQRFPDRYPGLLESVSRGTPQARYDLLFAASGPRLTLRSLDELQSVRGAPPVDGSDFLQHLDRWWRSEWITRRDDSDGLPFHGGWFLYLGYELAGQIEPRLTPARAPDPAPPVAVAVRAPAAIIRDHATRKTWLVAEPGHDALLRRMLRDLDAVGRPCPDGLSDRSGPVLTGPLVEEDPARFLAGVRHIQRHITDGDVFQVNLSRAWSARVADPDADAVIYRRLRASNPAPFAGLAAIDDTTIMSSSPERLVCVRRGVVDTRPIAGTRPRGADPGSDAALSARLLRHPKEQAEHIMLIDLERNDLGRVCRPGTVEVSELMALESYAHVHHIVSNVRGALRSGVTPGQVIRAVFPGGTITGCPKVRCMEIIADIEGAARGPYTGAIGYLGRDGEMDLNILIRTLVRSGNGISLRAGAGIVADSVPQKELEETRAKARGLIRALEGA